MFGKKQALTAEMSETSYGDYLKIYDEIEKRLRNVKAEMGGAYTLFVVGIVIFVVWTVVVVMDPDGAKKLGATGEAIPWITSAAFVVCGAILFLVEDWLNLRTRQIYLRSELAQQTEMLKLVVKSWSEKKKDAVNTPEIGALFKELRNAMTTGGPNSSKGTAPASSKVSDRGH